MKALAVALLFLLPLVPTTTAEPGCPEESVVVGEYERHTVTTHDDCSVDVVMNEGIVCLGGGVERSDSKVGPVHVTSYYCGWPGPKPIEFAPGDIYLPRLYECIWAGSYKPLVETPIVTVWHYTCDDPHS